MATVSLSLDDIYNLANKTLLANGCDEETSNILSDLIMKAGESFFENPMDTPFIPTWHRVKSAIPDFLDRFKESVKADNKEFK